MEKQPPAAAAATAAIAATGTWATCGPFRTVALICMRPVKPRAGNFA
jgi:hypothetical protein